MNDSRSGHRYEREKLTSTNLREILLIELPNTPNPIITFPIRVIQVA